MTRSGIDTNVYGSYSTRGVSTSKAKQKMVPIAEILQKDGWSRQKTFAKFYKFMKVTGLRKQSSSKILG